MPIQKIVMASDACARVRHTLLAPFVSRPAASWRLCQFSVVGKPAVFLGKTQRCVSEGSASEAIEGGSACDAYGGTGQPQTPAALRLNATIFHSARVVPLAVDARKAGVKSRGVGCITKPGGPLAWLPPLVTLPNQRRRFCDFLGLQN